MSTPLAAPFSPVAAGTRPTGFDRVAWCYDVLAGLVFGPAQRRAQQAALVGLPAGAPHVLILGGGTGWVLLEVLRCRPQATVLYLEASPKMLTRASTRLARVCPAATTQIEFRHGTQAALAHRAIRFGGHLFCTRLPCAAGVYGGIGAAAEGPAAGGYLVDGRLSARSAGLAAGAAHAHVYFFSADHRAAGHRATGPAPRPGEPGIAGG